MNCVTSSLIVWFNCVTLLWGDCAETAASVHLAPTLCISSRSLTHRNMVIEEKLLSVLTLVISCIAAGQTGSLLVVPMDGSHWTGVKSLAEEMGQRGHDVVVVIPEVSMSLGPSKHCTTKVYPVPYRHDLVDIIARNNRWIMGNETFFQKTIMLMNAVYNYSNYMKVTTESLLYNEEIMSYLKEKQFDALLTDPAWPIGTILAEHLDIPSIYMLRGMPCSLDSEATACPAPPSFVPRFLTRYSDHMTFPQRIVNMLVSLVEPIMCQILYGTFEELATRFFQRDVTVLDLLKRGSLWLIRIDYTLETPKPFMPNMVMIGGINCVVRNILPQVSLSHPRLHLIIVRPDYSDWGDNTHFPRHTKKGNIFSSASCCSVNNCTSL
ncbi:UDP-glucuronosyltransferase 1-6-like isoform X2 [Arapaima gigas]